MFGGKNKKGATHTQSGLSISLDNITDPSLHQMWAREAENAGFEVEDTPDSITFNDVSLDQMGMIADLLKRGSESATRGPLD